MPTTSHQVAYSFVERLAVDLKDARFELPAYPEAVLRVQRALEPPDTGAGDVVDIPGRLSATGNSTPMLGAEA